MALAIYGIVCFTVSVCLTFGFYELMQPRRIANPGLAAHKPPPGMAINLVGLAPPAPLPEIITVSLEPPAQTLDTSASQRQTKPKAAKAKPERRKPQRAARLRQQRDPMMSYAFQPSFGSYRSSW